MSNIPNSQLADRYTVLSAAQDKVNFMVRGMGMMLGQVYFGKHLGASKNNGTQNIPKMDGEYNGKPYFLMDDLGVTPIFGNTHLFSTQKNAIF